MNGEKLLINKELIDKKSLVALSLFTIIMLFFKLLSISMIFILVVFIVIIFKVLKWIFWIFLRPRGKDKEKFVKRKKLVDKIVSIIMGVFMVYFIIVNIIFSLYYDKSTSLTDIGHINKLNINTEMAHEKQRNIHSNLNSCESLKSRFQSCVSRSYRGLECFPGTDIVLPERCKY